MVCCKDTQCSVFPLMVVWCQAASSMLCCPVHLPTGIHTASSTPLPLNSIHCTALHCTALHCTALHYSILRCTTLQCSAGQCLLCLTASFQPVVTGMLQDTRCFSLHSCTGFITIHLIDYILLKFIYSYSQFSFNHYTTQHYTTVHTIALLCIRLYCTSLKHFTLLHYLLLNYQTPGLQKI